MSSHETARDIRVKKWLDSGGVVVSATDRAARSIAAAFHRSQRSAGLTAWETAAIVAWESWIRERWLERNAAGLLLLNPLQEQSLWTRVIAGRRAGTGLLHPDQLANAAQRAYRLLCEYAPDTLAPRERLGWMGDAAVFSEWIAEFESRCRREELISASRLTLELTAKLEKETSGSAERSPLLLIGFDRLLDSQRSLLNAWSDGSLARWQFDELKKPANNNNFYVARDGSDELSACVAWIRQRLEEKRDARLMVITTALQQKRGEIERALLAVPPINESALDFEFSLGVSLGQVSIARSALLLLRWLDQPLAEAEVDWLISSGHIAQDAAEKLALAEAMRHIRRKGLERTDWTLEAFFNPAPENAPRHEKDYPARPFRLAPPETWTRRFLAARQLLGRQAELQSPIEWSEVATQLLETAGWPGFRPLSSDAFQARQRWEKVLEDCATLGFESSAGMKWAEFVSAVSSAVANTIFATESSEAAVQISGPLEAAGQLADGIWFLGADEENWPSRGSPNALLPIRLQREAGMPHSTPQTDWGLAHEATTRLLASADEVVFSYAEQVDQGEARPSRLVVNLAGVPVAIGRTGTAEPARLPLVETFADTSLIAYPHASMAGGAGTLTRQSLCPFQSFAVARLGAERWQTAEAGLNARDRGQLLHAVLHRIWSKEDGGLASLAELRAVPDLSARVREVVDWAIERKLSPSLHETLPRRFLELEAIRLTNLVVEWLSYEQSRLPFSVEGTEVKSEVNVAGLSLNLRLDRVDVLQDGSLLVIDYKSSQVGPSEWDGDRPRNVQLPLYASVALGESHKSETLQGLVFGRVRPGDTKFYGRARNAGSTIDPTMSNRARLFTDPLTDEQLSNWRKLIHRLGKDFLHGRADVDPLDKKKTCEQCQLHSVCRIRENATLSDLIEEDESSDSEFAGQQTEGDASE